MASKLRRRHRGTGIPQDHAEAGNWIRLVTEQGLVDAQFNLGVSYSNGESVPQGLRNGPHAAESGVCDFAETHGSAAAHPDSVASKMTAEAIREAQRLAREWRPQATSANANAEQRQ